MIKIAICDDRPEEAEAIQKLAQEFSESHSEYPLGTRIFSSPYDLLDCIGKSGGFDLYILDILMPHLDGIELARKIRERGEPAEILFLTISREYGVEAFTVQAAGYLVKPVKKEEFEKVFHACMDSLAPKDNPSLLLKTKYGIRKVPVRRIVMAESFNHRYVCMLADGTAIEVSDTLSSLYEQLHTYPGFFMPHRAYIVNLEYVNGLTSSELFMANGKNVPVSRKNYNDLKAAYMDYVF